MEIKSLFAVLAALTSSVLGVQLSSFFGRDSPPPTGAADQQAGSSSGRFDKWFSLRDSSQDDSHNGEDAAAATTEDGRVESPHMFTSMKRASKAIAAMQGFLATLGDGDEKDGNKSGESKPSAADASAAELIRQRHADLNSPYGSRVNGFGTHDSDIDVSTRTGPSSIEITIEDEDAEGRRPSDEIEAAAAISTSQGSIGPSARPTLVAPGSPQDDWYDESPYVSEAESDGTHNTGVSDHKRGGSDDESEEAPPGPTSMEHVSLLSSSGRALVEHGAESDSGAALAVDESLALVPQDELQEELPVMTLEVMIAGDSQTGKSTLGIAWEQGHGLGGLQVSEVQKAAYDNVFSRKLWYENEMGRFEMNRVLHDVQIDSEDVTSDGYAVSKSARTIVLAFAADNPESFREVKRLKEEIRQHGGGLKPGVQWVLAETKVDQIRPKNLNAAWLKANFVNDVAKNDLKRANDLASPVYDFLKIQILF